MGNPWNLQVIPSQPLLSNELWQPCFVSFHHPKLKKRREGKGREEKRNRVREEVRGYHKEEEEERRVPAHACAMSAASPLER